MMRARVATFGLIGAVASAPSTRREPIANFSIVLEATPKGWSARCDMGCGWSELGFACPTACGAIVDQNGLVTLASLRPDSTTFMFLVEHTPNGATAVSRKGTAWVSLSWKCESLPCRARITARGVE